jgi:hypothetical protein
MIWLDRAVSSYCRVCLYGECEARVPSFLAESTNNSHVSLKSMDKTEDGQTIERTHDLRTTYDTVIFEIRFTSTLLYFYSRTLA